MANELPNLGADIVLEFTQSLNNIKLFGEALEALDEKFYGMERRIDAMRASMSSLSAEVSRGTGQNLRHNIEREINNLIQANGIAVANYGGKALKINARTVQNVFAKVDKALNDKLAQAYSNIVIDINPSLQVGKIPIDKDDLDEVNKAIARLVRVQLNNLVGALRKHGAGLISTQDLATLQFHIGKDTVQQIINRIKDHIKKIMLNPNVATGAAFEITERDMNRVFNSIRSRVREAIDNAVTQVRTSPSATDLPNVAMIQEAINDSARRYVQDVAAGIRSMSRTVFETPLNQVSTQLRRFMAKELGTDLAGFNQLFADHKFSSSELYSAELRRQFARMEQALNRKIGGGLNEEVRRIVRSIEQVEISYSPRLHQHLTREINKINNQIVKKIREQIDVQFAHMRAEIAGVQVAPKDINRARRVREMGRVHYDEAPRSEAPRRESFRTIANDPYARRDAYFNTFGLQGAIINTFRHILAGSMVGAPIMLLYQSIESFKTSQLEQLKMFSNLYAKAVSETNLRLAEGDRRTSEQVARDTIADIMPYVREAAQFYAIDYGQMTEIASVGSRLLEDAAEVKSFTDTVGKIFSIDREGDPVNVIAPGLEAFMGQFDLAVGELDERVVRPLAVATNVTNATTDMVMQAMMRSGSAFRTAGVTPEEAIAMVATTLQYTGLSGENIGNFYKSILPRLQSPNSLRQLERIGIDVYEEIDGVRHARSATEILRDVAFAYQRLEDPEARNTIMNMFGTYQSAKGTVTLEELGKFNEVIEAINEFSMGDLYELLGYNLDSPILRMQRAGTATELALASVIEELTPEIVALSDALTGLATGIREHREALGDFVRFLGNALVGFATVYGTRRLWGAMGGGRAIERVETIDNLLGNASRVPQWRREGLLQSFTDLPNVRRGALDNTRQNRQFINRALQDEQLEPVIRNLANMTDEQRKAMRAYIIDNNLLVKDMKDLIMIAEESRDYRPAAQLTDEERWGGAQYNASRLYNKGMQGVDKDFIESFTAELRDKQRFDQLSSTDRGRRVTTFIAGMDENELVRFRQHLEDTHRRTGAVIRDFDSLANAVDSYTVAQQRNREELRRTNPHMVTLSSNLDRVARSLNSNSLRNGMQNFNTFLGSLSQRARGAVSAIGGLARTVGGFAGQMLLFAGIGEVITNIGSSGVYTQEQRNLNLIQKQVQDINEYKNWVRMGGFAAGLQHIWDSAVGLWDIVTLGGDNYTDALDKAVVGKDFTDFLNEVYGAQLPTNASPNAMRSNIKKYIEQIGAEEDEIFDEFMNWASSEGNESVMENLRKAQLAEFERRFEEMTLQEEELRSLQERLQAKVDERTRREVMQGSYRLYDLETVRKTISQQVDEINARSLYEQLSLLSRGVASDSEEFVEIRKRQNNQIKELYDEQIRLINEFITNAKSTLDEMLSSGADEDDIKAQREVIEQWERNRERVLSEFGAQSLQLEQENQRLEYEAAMSRITREAAINDANRAIQEAVNSVTMDRQSKEYVDASIELATSKIRDLQFQIESMRSAAQTEDQRLQIAPQIAQLQATIEQERVNIRNLQLSRIGLYKQELQDELAQMSNDYLQARVDAGAVGEDSPLLRNLRIQQYERQVGMFNELISDLQRQLRETNDPEMVRDIQREIRDLQRQSLQAQLGILDEMKNTGGTFNLPDNVRAMSYYEYITRNSTHSTYTVQGGDVNVTVTLPNITDGTSVERIRDIGRALGQGLNEGRSLRLQKQHNPFSYRGV